MSVAISLTDAILAFINAPDWSTRKKVVERHRDLLLGEEADSVLMASAANNSSRPEVQKRFELCRTVLADCRAIGVDAAFILLTGSTPGLLQAVKELLGGESATAVHESTVRDQALLLTDEADWVLAALAHENPQETWFVERVTHRRELLGRCRSEGIDAAFADMLREDRTTAALKALIPAIGSPEEAGIVLRRYEDVCLTDTMARSVEQMAAQPDVTPDVARIFAAMRSLLSIARVDGVSTASATYLLPPFEQFLNRYFLALAKEDPSVGCGNWAPLQAEFGKVGNDFPKELSLWCQNTLETATQKELKIYVFALIHLGRALKDLSTGSATTYKEAATACFQIGSRFAQRLSVLRQKQARKEQIFGSVQEAVDAAMRMKTDDGFDLFRGQRCAWPLVSSFRRLDAQLQANASARVNEFINWAKKEAALAQYGFSSDQAIAVAQHYGVATTFLDFSTDIEVARYFATEHCLEASYQSAAGHSELSCIVAIRSTHLDAWVKERFRQTDQFLGSQILRLDVPNLWRLEAQAGVFLVDSEIIDDYPFHYLLFPASVGPEPLRDRSAVYPEKKSDLELMLEQWFWHEKVSLGTRRIKEMFDQINLAPRILTVETTDGIGLKGILRPEPHHSWAARERTWLRATEPFGKVLPRAGDTYRIHLQPGMSLNTVQSLVATLLPLESLADRRTRSADWRVLIDDAIDPAATESVARQWDALRIDGYSDAQIVASITASISILALRLGLIAGWPSYDGHLASGDDIEPLRSLFGCDLLVEFTGLVGYGRALVNAGHLQSAVREDIYRYVPAALHDGCGRSPAECMHELLIGIQRPSLLFDFTRFADVYVRYVVPTSVILRPEYPLYPVLHLQTFGVP